MKTNISLADLKFLIGDWKTQISEASFLDTPSTKLYGKTSFQWFEDETFLIMRSSFEENGPPTSISIISCDDTNKQYQMLYYDARGVSRIYNMSFEHHIWKLWRKAEGLSQRFEAKVSDDGKVMNAFWNKSTDGKTWERDFDIQYEKLN